MMMCLGLFVFGLDTAAYQEFERQTTWKYGKNARVGRRDAYQYVGDGDDNITLKGWIAPELTGTVLSLDALREMAGAGKAWILIRGTGRIYGAFVITSVNETHTYIDKNGNARRIEFTIALERTDEGLLSLVEQLGDITSMSQLADMAGLGAVADRAKGVLDTVTNVAEKLL